MAINAGDTIRANDFIDASGIPTPQSDAEGKGVKLNNQGKVDAEFLPPVAAEADTIIAPPNFLSFSVNSTSAGGGNTRMFVGQVIVPFKISVAKFSFHNGVIVEAGTYKFAVYSEDGQTKHLEFSVALTTETGLIVNTISPAVVLEPAVYWIAHLPTGSPVADFRVQTYVVGNAGSLYSGRSPILSGFIDGVTADTIPATLNIGSITAATAATPIIRLESA